ncbi:MAG: multicopper oxidase domain-containing protein [Acidobacteriia bacterium]|nr:multicopper oxidase domain-containing protein [Terriglobia bacterium]
MNISCVHSFLLRQKQVSLFLLALPLAAAIPVFAATETNLPVVSPNDNRASGGVLKNGVLTIKLELREARWYPDKDGGPSVTVMTFAEEGHAPQIPGPMIRVPEGTEIHASVRNLLSAPATLNGLHARPGEASDTIEIAPGQAREVNFKTGTTGTYFYSARTTKEADPTPAETPLSGAFIVDPAGQAPNDRVFVIGLWYELPDKEVLTVNGKSYPYTERLTYTQGEETHWRWINASVSEHAMHLHGFYYTVNSSGSAERDTIYSPEQRRKVVTEHLDSGGTMSATWVPEQIGNWVFHCHMVAHMGTEARLGHAEHAKHEGATYEDPADPADAAGFGGLVVKITILPKAGKEPTVTAAAAPTPRKLRLLVKERPATEQSLSGFAFQIQEGEAEPTDKLSVPGPLLVLTRGQPVEITVVNQLHKPTSIHWHGIELESYYDGLAGFGGSGTQISPPVPPGGTFIARMTPPRAGTFIYHTHWHDFDQLTGGLYGPLIVVEPGGKLDPETDKVFILSRGKLTDTGTPLLMNGKEQPRPLKLLKGRKYRFRLINITPNDADAVFTLKSGETVLQWRLVAKDGQGVPAAQAILKTATQIITVGETYDFEFQPDTPGELHLEAAGPFSHRWVIFPLVVTGK